MLIFSHLTIVNNIWSNVDLWFCAVLGCQVMDPQIAAWLLDPADSSSCFQTLLSKHYTHQVMPTSLQHVLGQAKVTIHTVNLIILPRKGSDWYIDPFTLSLSLIFALSGDSSDLKFVSPTQANEGTA